MAKNKYWVVGLGTVLVLGIGSGVLVWTSHGKRHDTRTASVQGAYSEVPLTETSDPNSIPLNQTRPQPKSNALSVTSGSNTNNLGQLTPSEDATNSAGSNSSRTPTIDPSTFSQYDKYKDGDAALFGEVQAGSGAELGMNMKAAVYYKGWLTNGQLFDTNKQDHKGQPQPFVFTMGAHEVIPGWEEGIIGMKVGGTRLIIVPPAVGYGAAGQGPIPGNSVLVFQVQLLAAQ